MLCLWLLHLLQLLPLWLCPLLGGWYKHRPWCSSHVTRPRSEDRLLLHLLLHPLRRPLLLLRLRLLWLLLQLVLLLLLPITPLPVPGCMGPRHLGLWYLRWRVGLRELPRLLHLIARFLSGLLVSRFL